MTQALWLLKTITEVGTSIGNDKDICIMSSILLTCSIIYRIASVFIVQTAYVLEEYWPLEVAHKLAFDYGHITWEWREGVNSYVYPFIISILYKILGIMQLDNSAYIVYSPRILQAILSAYADYRFYCWTKSMLGYLSLSTNWFWFYCASRTLTNTLETSLTMIVLSIFPFINRAHRNSTEDCRFLWIVGFTCIIRPTIVIMWIPLCTYHFLANRRRISYLISRYSSIGMWTLVYATVIDSYCHGSFVFTPWYFVKYIGQFYGPRYSLYLGLVMVLGPLCCIFLPLIMFKLFINYQIYARELTLFFTINWTLAMQSIVGYSEWRFILPVLPMLIYLCTYVKPPDYVLSNMREGRMQLVLILIILTLLPAWFSSLYYNRSLDIMEELRNKFETYDANYRHNYRIAKGVDILFLTPCHILPVYSHLHKNVTTRFLTCEPTLEGRKNYLNESDEFSKNATQWIHGEILMKNQLPVLVVIFDDYIWKVANLLKYYKKIAENRYWQMVKLGDDWRMIRKSIRIYECNH